MAADGDADADSDADSDSDADADGDVDGDGDADCPDVDQDGHDDSVCGGDDCDDSDDTVHPGASDPLGDCVDRNCDGVDSADEDLDGHGSVACGGDDCDDRGGDVYPGAPDEWGDATDMSCDGSDGVDSDRDAFAANAAYGADCDDADPAVHPNVLDQEGDGVDANCDGVDGYGPAGNPLANGGCNWTDNDPAAPQFRLTAIDFTAPEPLVRPSFRDAVRAGVDVHATVMLVDLHADGTFALGSGLCAEDPAEGCAFEGGDYPPAGGTATYSAASGAFRLPADGGVDLALPVRGEYSGEAVLRLREAVLEGTTSHDSNCVGARTNDFLLSEWDTSDGTLTAKLAVDDSRATFIDDPFGPVGSTLCDLLADCGGGGCCDVVDQDAWTNPPDTAIDGEPAWALSADVAAIGARID